MTTEREVAVMTRNVIEWGHARWPGCRAIRELVLGHRRIDVIFACERDLIGVEIKSSKDKIDRLEAQYTEFTRYVPEVWIAVAPRWRDAVEKQYRVSNKMVVDGTSHQVETIGTYRSRPGEPGIKPYRDELSIARLIELLWRDEMAAVAERTGAYPGAGHKQVKTATLQPMLARLLTGNEILAEVCRCLRERPMSMIGRGSDPPIRRPSATDAPPGRPGQLPLSGAASAHGQAPEAGGRPEIRTRETG
jgi:hypothetical protein